MEKNLKQKNNVFTVLIKRNSNKAVVKRYDLPFENPFEAMDWGTKQAESFGPGYIAELASIKDKKTS